MKDETLTWLSYADENFDVSMLAFNHGHLNSSLQNVQQAVEKYLKAIIIEKSMELKRTHSIRELVSLLSSSDIIVDINDDEQDLLDSIYIPSKYPVYSALPDAMPTPDICEEALKIVKRVKTSLNRILSFD
jgi:HEPN domain-containing protein